MRYIIAITAGFLCRLPRELRYAVRCAWVGARTERRVWRRG